MVSAPGKFLELPLGNLHHHVVDGRLKACRRLARDVVLDFIQRHADRQARRDFGDGKAGGLRGQRRTARNARVHLDHHHAAVRRIDGELNVRAARLHADLADDRRRSVPHPLVFLVGQRLRGSHGDRVAGVHAHGIEVFDRANHHEVVAEIAHHLEFIFLPAQHRLFHQSLVHRTGVQRRGDELSKLLAVVRNRSPRPAQRERRPDHHGVPKLVGQFQSLLRVVHQRRGRHFEADLPAGVLEPQPVFRHLDGAQRRSNQFDAVFIEHAAFGQFHGQIQARLAPDGGQQRVRLFARDDLLERGARERLDVGPVGHFRIGHDRGRIRIDQHHLIAVRPQRLARLRARVIEFAGLPDHDGAGADDQNLLDVGAFWHRYFADFRLAGFAADASPRRGAFESLLSFIMSVNWRNR